MIGDAFKSFKKPGTVCALAADDNKTRSTHLSDGIYYFLKIFTL
jgi:hypothetical protein